MTEKPPIRPAPGRLAWKIYKVTGVRHRGRDVVRAHLSGPVAQSTAERMLQEMIALDAYTKVIIEPQGRVQAKPKPKTRDVPVERSAA